jgi:hypothetical protein
MLLQMQPIAHNCCQTIKKDMAKLQKNGALLLLIACCLNGYFLQAQHTSVNINAYTGLFSFRGNGASSFSSNYTIPYQIYGKDPGFSYAYEVQVKRITRRKHLFGLGIAKEKVKTKTEIIFYPTDIELPYYDPAIPLPSQTILTNSFVTVNPFVGHQFSVGSILIDAVAGLDWAYCTKSYVDIKTVWLGFVNEKIKGSVDWRTRVQLNASYKHLVLLVGYSRGITKFDAGFNKHVSTNFLRMGVGFRID